MNSPDPHQTNIDPRYVLDISVDDIMAAGWVFLARMREEMPVAYLPCLSAWLITKADDVIHTMRTQESFRIFLPEHTTDPVLGPMYIQGQITPEQYSRIRKGADAALNPKAMQHVVPNIMVPCIAAHLDRLARTKKFDLLDDLMGPINFDVMKRVLGIPLIPNETLNRWYEGIHEAIENMAGDPVKMQRGRQLGAEIDEAFVPIVSAIDAKPDGSLISHMLATAEGSTLDERRRFIMGHLKTLLLAGAQEGAHAAVNTVIGLHTSPLDLETLRADPEKYVDLAVEEGVRWLPPVAAVHRRTIHDVEIRGARIAAENDILISVASASRDHERWGPDADEFVLARFSRDRQERMPQLGFGHLPRPCQGSSFIRNFVHHSLTMLFQRFPRLRPDPDHEWRVPGGIMSNYCHMRCIVD